MDFKTKVLIHIAAIRPWVKLDHLDKPGFTPGLRFLDDELVYNIFEAMPENSHGIMAQNDEIPTLVEKALVQAGHIDYNDACKGVKHA